MGMFETSVDGVVHVDALDPAGNDRADLRNRSGEQGAVRTVGRQHFVHTREVRVERVDGVSALGVGFLGKNVSLDVVGEASLRVREHLLAAEARREAS